MNLLKNQTLHLRDEEALVVENAIRLAIDSIVNVLYGVNSARTHEYQRMVADRDQEIQRLEGSVTEIARELKALRRRGCTCAPFGKEHRLVGPQAAAEESRFDPSCGHTEMTAGQQECEMSISVGLFARPPSHASSQSHESALRSSPSRMGLDRSGISHCSDSSGASEEARNLPMSPSSLVIKEEPCDIDTVLIKWEMSEERFRELQESPGSPCQDFENPGAEKNMENMEGTLKEIPCADPSGYYDPHEEHLRNQKMAAPMSEQTEEAQRLKRAAWRAASRRYYARKVARQQANTSRSVPMPVTSRPTPFPSRSGPALFPSRSGPTPFPSRSGPTPFPSRSGPTPFPSRSGPALFPSRSGPFPHMTDSRYPQPISFVDKRRRTLISDLPEASQSLQREAWRAASKRYYARKNARHQTEPIHYEHLLQNMEPSGDPLEPNRGDSHANSGIMCSS
ncbi:uncharacterized protein LOC117728354 [Cyclopterus lumpus]|uniref:uncharacterized protein LOC117728354 n=1 Tax=Cyclopterus lumpus TaxID=8103 RepID=UPI001486EBC1|nr:uncharacterized protein LOC117728354 [Cyclopterus lumpus]